MLYIYKGRSHCGDIYEGRSHCGYRGETKQVQQFQFQTLKILLFTLFTGAQKLCGPEISRFSPYMLQFLDNIQWLLIFSNNIG